MQGRARNKRRRTEHRVFGNVPPSVGIDPEHGALAHTHRPSRARPKKVNVLQRVQLARGAGKAPPHNLLPHGCIPDHRLEREPLPAVDRRVRHRRQFEQRRPQQLDVRQVVRQRIAPTFPVPLQPVECRAARRVSPPPARAPPTRTGKSNGREAQETRTRTRTRARTQGQERKGNGDEGAQDGGRQTT